MNSGPPTWLLVLDSRSTSQCAVTEFVSPDSKTLDVDFCSPVFDFADFPEAIRAVHIGADFDHGWDRRSVTEIAFMIAPACDAVRMAWCVF